MTALVPMLPEAPGRFSATTWVPSRLDRFSAMMRPLVSVTPPGEKGMIKRMLLPGWGNSSFALAGFRKAAPMIAVANALAARSRTGLLLIFEGHRWLWGNR